MGKSPDKIVADIDRKQNEEDKDLIPRAGRMIKEKLDKDLTGGAYVGNKLNMGNTSSKKELQKQNDIINDAEFHSNYGKKTGGKVSASSRADGCAIRGKTRA